MKTTHPLTCTSVRPAWAWIALLLVAIAVATSESQGAPPDAKPESEERFGKRVLNFFKKIGDRDEKERNADNRPRVSLDQPPGARTPDSGSIASRVHAGENPVVPPPTSPAPPVAKKKAPPPPVQAEERETRQSATSPETRNESPPTENVDAAKRQLADLKRKVADMEAQLAKSQGDKESAKTAPPPGEYEIPLTAPASPPPPRGVAPAAVDTPPKKSFASESPISSTTAPTPSKTDVEPSASASAGQPPASANGGTTDALPAAGKGTSSAVPIAAKTEKPGIVKSPHPPYNEVDVSGLQKGTLAKDPTTQKIFRIP